MKTTSEEKLLVDQIRIGSIVQHYKGNKMKVLGIARHTEDHTLHVIYQKLYDCEKFGDHAVVIRPLKMFLENVLLNGEVLPRFKIVQEHSCGCC